MVSFRVSRGVGGAVDQFEELLIFEAVHHVEESFA
jgi:hypothetical protein